MALDVTLGSHIRSGTSYTDAQDIGASTRLMVCRDMLFHIHALQMYDKIMVVLLRALHPIGMLAGAFQSAAFVRQKITS